MEKSFVFNSINGDRKYKAEDFREYFATFIGNGVFPNPSTNLQCIGENGDMTVVLKKGPGWINGALYVNDNDLILPIDVADGVLNRIDRIVLRMDTIGRAINAVVKKGAFASSPVAPVLQRDADGYEIGIADIYIAAGATQITQAAITDLRLNTSLCGIVHGTVEQVDTTTLFNQYLTWLNQKKAQYDADMLNWTAQKQADFNTWYNNTTSASQTEIDNMEAQFQQDWNNWFATVQSALDGDTAGNLLNLINQNTSSITNLVEDVNTHKAETASQDTLGHVKKGTDINIDVNGVISVDSGNTAGKILKLPAGLTNGDMLYVNSSGQLVRLPKGAVGQTLKVNADGTVGWGSLTDFQPYLPSNTGLFTWNNTIQKPNNQYFEVGKVLSIAIPEGGSFRIKGEVLAGPTTNSRCEIHVIMGVMPNDGYHVASYTSYNNYWSPFSVDFSYGVPPNSVINIYLKCGTYIYEGDIGIRNIQICGTKGIQAFSATI